MKSLQSNLSIRLCLFVIGAVPTVFLPNIAGATNLSASSANQAVVNVVAPIQVAANLSDKLIALSPKTETLGLRGSFVRSEGWVQQQYVPKSTGNVNQVASNESPSAAAIFQSLSA
jgi:hypothetical protein